MKKIIMLCIGVICMALAVQAQDSTQAAPKKGPGNGWMEMMQQLHLSPDQKARLQALHTQERNRLDSIQNNNSLPDEEKKAQLRAARQLQRKAMEAVLTPEQKEKLKTLRQEMMEKRKMHNQDADSTGL